MVNGLMYGKALRELGVSYLGAVGQSKKMRLSKENGTTPYCLYLAPATLAGKTRDGKKINVCPNSKYCAKFCLNGSGQNKADELSRGIEGSLINRSRIKKTRLFYEDRALFMRLLIHEIRTKQRLAKRLNMPFSVRLNGTSDLSPMLFIDPDTGKNILELFSDVTFYDYSKRPSAMHEAKMFKNYDVTFSYDGHNFDRCEKYLRQGGKAAVVFYGKALPKKFAGYPVVDGNLYDMRYLDPKGCVIGLHYHVVANDFKVIDGKRKFVEPESEFVVKCTDSRCTM